MVALISVVPLSLGCAPKFQAPKESAPHAVVEFRALYHAPNTPSRDFLKQTVKLDGRAVPMSVPARVKAEPIVKVIRVPPAPNRWQVVSELSHADTVRSREPAPLPATSSCPAGLATCAQPNARERDQWVTEYVIDARCEAQLVHQPQAGHSYRLEYDFYGPGKCSLRIVEQTN